MSDKSPDSPVPTAVNLGELRSTKCSFLPNLILPISKTTFTWGRALGCVNECPDDTRVPKTAFQISWYAPTTTSRSKRKSRTKDGEFLITTFATHGIRVNGQPLTQCDTRGYSNHGFLRTGDIITISYDENEKKKLKFVCKFHYGKARHKREAGKRFQIFGRSP